MIGKTSPIFLNAKCHGMTFHSLMCQYEDGLIAECMCVMYACIDACTDISFYINYICTPNSRVTAVENKHTKFILRCVKVLHIDKLLIEIT